MSRKWRWSLLGVLVAIVISGLMPNALLSGAETRASSTLSTTVVDFFTPQSVSLSFLPVSCPDASCGRGSPAPGAPTLTVVAAASMVAVLALAALGRKSRRLRYATAVLPRGNFMGLYRPPQFS